VNLVEALGMLTNLLDNVPVIADWASIISLVVSTYAAYAITKVRSQVVGRVRMPSLVAAIEKSGKKFAILMRSYDEVETREQFVLELARCEATLRLIKSKASRATAGRVRALLQHVSNFKGPRWFGYYPAANRRDDAWRIYTELNSLIEELKNVIEEQKIGA
jgi:hypothetical protein